MAEAARIVAAGVVADRLASRSWRRMAVRLMLTAAAVGAAPSAGRAADPPCHEQAPAAPAGRPTFDAALAAEGDRLSADARQAYDAGRVDDAVKSWGLAAERYGQGGCPDRSARMLVQLASVQIAGGGYMSALAYLYDARNAVDEKADRALAITIHRMIGSAHTLRQEFEEAETGRRSEKNEPAEPLSGLYKAWLLLGEGDRGAGLGESGVGSGELGVGNEAPATAPVANSPTPNPPPPTLPLDRLRAAVLMDYGNLRTSQVGQIRVRVKYTDDQIDEDKALADRYQDDALACYATAGRLAARAGDPVLEARAAVNAGVSAARDVMQQDDPDEPAKPSAGRLKQVRDLNGQALGKVAALPDSRDKVNLMLTAGHTDQLLATVQAAPAGGAGGGGEVVPADAAGRAESARRAMGSYQDGIRLAQRIGDPLGESYAAGFLGTLYEDFNQDRDARTLATRATFLADKAQVVQGKFAEYRWQWLNARLMARQAAASANPADRNAAIDAYRRALETLKVVKGDLVLGYGNGDTRSSFRKEIAPIYYEAADLLLTRAREAGRAGRDADKQRDLVEARETVERLKSSELAAYFRDDCASSLPERAITDVTAGTAVVYIIPLRDRIELLVNVPPAGSQTTAAAGGAENLVQLDPTPVTAAQLDRTAGQFRNALEDRARTAYKDRGEELYKWLIKPVVPLLTERQVNTLVFVPDGVLRSIPMSALYDGKEFLVQKYAVAVTPGLRLMDSGRGGNRAGVKLLINALSEEVRFENPGEPDEVFPALKNVPVEVQNLKDTFGPDRQGTLMNEQFKVENVEGQLRDTPEYSIVHVASHGEFRGDVKRTFLVAHEEKVTLNRLENLIKRKQFAIRKGETPVDLLTLSACQTAAGDDRAALGLAGVAIKAGARSALASLWYINDDSSVRLVSEFYRQLAARPDLTKAQALREAQLSLLRDPDLQHPLYWAPFLMIGNWQ